MIKANEQSDSASNAKERLKKLKDRHRKIVPESYELFEQEVKLKGCKVIKYRERPAIRILSQNALIKWIRNTSVPVAFDELNHGLTGAKYFILYPTDL